MEIDHKYESSGQDADMGKHNKVSLLEQADLGTGATGKPILGAQTVNGKAELFFTDEDDNDIQITSGGNLIAAPSGIISMWSGAISAIPTGWVICDGTNSTPNLTDRFVIHADADAAGTNDVGDTGGAHTVALSIAELAAHTHTYVNPAGIGQAGAGGDGNEGPADATGSTGSGTAHQNMPKYYALAYIMKT